MIDRQFLRRPARALVAPVGARSRSHTAVPIATRCRPSPATLPPCLTDDETVTPTPCGRAVRSCVPAAARCSAGTGPSYAPAWPPAGSQCPRSCRPHVSSCTASCATTPTARTAPGALPSSPTRPTPSTGWPRTPASASPRPSFPGSGGWPRRGRCRRSSSGRSAPSPPSCSAAPYRSRCRVRSLRNRSGRRSRGRGERCRSPPRRCRRPDCPHSAAGPSCRSRSVSGWPCSRGPSQHSVWLPTGHGCGGGRRRL